MKTIIHIGQHKTGTTSIQHYLKNNHDNLISEGLYVPVGLAGFDNPSHFILNLYALAENRMSSMKERFISKPSEFFDSLFTELKKDIREHYELAKEKGCDAVLWSNEGLYLLNSHCEYKKLFKLFNEYSSNVHCVCCFREVNSYRQSYITQLQKQGISKADDKDSYRYMEDDSWLFDYERKKQLLHDVFDTVVTFDYDENDNLSRFLGTLGYSTDHVHDQKRLNVTCR